jgi:hypothetical protein
MSRLRLALEQLELVRRYTIRLLDAIDVKDWFRQPPGGITHVAWQVGHLAMAEYRLALQRTRGRRSEDAELISDEFLRLFARESTPDPDRARYPSPEAIRMVFDRVHQQALLEVPRLSEEELDQPVDPPHPIARTKFSSLMWCAVHEGVHAGQIGLLRRLHGYPPLW